MNIKILDLYKQFLRQLTSNFGKLMANGILVTIVGAISLAVFVLYPAYFTIEVFADYNTKGTLFSLAVLIFLVIYLIGMTFKILFSLLIARYAIADGGFAHNRGFTDSYNKVNTRSNFKFALITNLIPLVVLISATCVVVFYIKVTGILLYVVFVCATTLTLVIDALFSIAIYTNDDAQEGFKTLKSSYSKSQIFGGIVHLVIIDLFAIGVLNTVELIPYLGVALVILLSPVLHGAIGQAMILEIKKQLYPLLNLSSVVINSDDLEVTINTAGAEIRSVIKDGVELMWQADSQYWGKTSPVLFPFVGKLKDDKYYGRHVMRPMNQHGFLRERNFNIVDRTKNSVCFEYRSSHDDFNLYPYYFTVQITYTVEGSKVNTEYKIINDNNYAMHYQIGAHPAFNVEDVDKLSLVFPEQQVNQHFFAEGLQTDVQEVTINQIDLSYDLINQNIPCYSNFQDNRVTLQKDGSDFIKFEFNTMKYLAVWSPEFKNAPFVCIEPWQGICGRADQKGLKIEDKDGMNILRAEGNVVHSYSFEIC